MDDNLINSISEIAKASDRIASRAVFEYSIEVDNIIGSVSIDENYIENTLDRMLDFCFDDKMDQPYKKLCRYYFKINPKAVEFYVNQYKEMWGDK